MSAAALKALFGAPLKGDKLLRYIYLDEAGTSASEPVSVVVGVIVDADKHWRLAQEKVNELLAKYVPPSLKGSFVFHAKSVWGDKSLRDSWPLEDRIALLCEIMAIPRELRMAVSVGVVQRAMPHIDNGNGTFSKAEMHHLMAFCLCVSDADSWLRNNAGQSEVATLICEDVPRMRRFLRLGLQFLKVNPWYLKESKIVSPEEGRNIEANQKDYIIKVERIIDTVHFVEKADGPLLQIADACAFAFRRCLAGQSYGDIFLQVVTGGPITRERIPTLPFSNTLSWNASASHQEK